MCVVPVNITWRLCAIGDPSKANIRIQGSCSISSGATCAALAVLAQAEVDGGRPFQMQHNLANDQEGAAHFCALRN